MQVPRPEETLRKHARLLIVDDDPDLCDLVQRYLEAEGFGISVVHSGAEGAQAGISGNYDLIVLDVMLPDIKGFDVLRELRSRARTPVLMLTAKGDEFDRVLGLQMGADDYLAKPFSPRELIARIGAILRRSSGEYLRLTSAEFDLLHAFLESPGHVLSREALAERVLGRKFSPFDRSIDLHVSNLRQKLGPQTNGAERIRSVRGIGYLYAWPL